MDTDKFKRLVARHRLPAAIVAVIGIAALLTVVSMSLYITSGTASLDLSRPGYKQVRDQVVSQPSETFNSNGPMNADVVVSFRQLFEAQKKSLNDLGDFSDASLDDASLQF